MFQHSSCLLLEELHWENCQHLEKSNQATILSKNVKNTIFSKINYKLLIQYAASEMLDSVVIYMMTILSHDG